jgi:two-component system sensor histidine kinase DegS
LREIVSDLRPPMLIYGLKPAIEELADNLMQRSGDSIKVTVEVQSGEERASQNIEQHLFRIVQEACENALRHAQAENIRITGRLTPEKIDLTIADDGIGFDVREQMDLEVLLASNHFGLAGIVERGYLIGAQVSTHSTLNAGTRIEVTWNSKPG